MGTMLRKKNYWYLSGYILFKISVSFNHNFSIFALSPLTIYLLSNHLQYFRYLIWNGPFANQSSYKNGLSSAPEPAATPPSFDFSNFVRNIWPQCVLYTILFLSLNKKHWNLKFYYLFAANKSRLTQWQRRICPAPIRDRRVLEAMDLPDESCTLSRLAALCAPLESMPIVQFRSFSKKC